MLFAKSPVRGRVKTRLAADVGEDLALEVARSLLLEALDQWGGGLIDRCWLMGDHPESRDFRLDVTGEWQYRYQGEGDLGERLVRAFESARTEVDAPMLAIAADAPRIAPELLLEAQSVCARGAAAVVPAIDGGYGLIALPAGRFSLAPIFPKGGWGRDDVMTRTRSAIQSQGLELKEFDRTEDVDNLRDLLSLADDLRNDGHLRERLPRLARLLCEFTGDWTPASSPDSR